MSDFPPLPDWFRGTRLDLAAVQVEDVLDVTRERSQPGAELNSDIHTLALAVRQIIAHLEESKAQQP